MNIREKKGDPRGVLGSAHGTLWINACRRGRLLCLILAMMAFLIVVPICTAAPLSFATLELNESYSSRNMTVSTIETIDLMDLSLTRVTLHSTAGDGTDMKNLTLPSFRNIRRVFTNDTATWSGNILTVADTDTTVSGSEMDHYTLFIEPYLPVFEFQVPDVQGDLVIVKANSSVRPLSITSLFESADLSYFLHSRGILGHQNVPNKTYILGWNIPQDFDKDDFGFTLLHNEVSLSPSFILSSIFAQMVSDPVNGLPPTTGEYHANAFRYDPGDSSLIIYAAWPVLILDGDNTLVLTGMSQPYIYNKRSADNLLLTFNNPSPVSNLSYILVKENETYDAQVNVNMTALEESGGAVSIDLILSGNPLLSILRDTGLGTEDLKKVVSYSIHAIDNTTPPHSTHFSKINITPGYGTSGYALYSSQVTIPHADLHDLLSGNFSIYALGADRNNTVIALDRDSILIGSSPLADFNASITHGEAPLPVQFTDISSDDAPTEWAWDFGDGTLNGTEKDPEHTYINPGLYTVTLTATNRFGSGTEQKVQYINVTTPAAPVADFSGSPTSGPAPLTVAFTDNSTGNITSRSWNFGDSGNSSLVDPSHTYTTAGTYTVNLTVTGPGGSDTESKTDYITVTPPVPPVAAFSGSPTSGYRPLFVQFTDQSTNNPTSWEWEYRMGSGSWTIFSDDAQNPSHTFTTVGQYSIRLTATNEAGSDTATASNYITVTEPPIQAGFTANPTAGFVPLFVQFTDASTGTITTRSWNFGDGGTSSAVNPSHTYTETGTYTVSLTVTGPAGTDSEVKPGYITVYSVPPAPVAQFTSNVTTGISPLSVQFTDLSSGSPFEWNWSFGDGTYSLERHPVHVYANPRNYTVSLRVRGLGGFDTETKPWFIHVLPNPPVANFSANVTSGDAPLSVQFTDLSTNNPTAWSWQFGDGAISSERNPVHVYHYAGNYTVSLTASSSQGSDTRVRAGYINVSGMTPPPPGLKADFVGAPTSGFVPLTVVFADTSTGDPVSWNWSFGDGSTSSAQNPTHIYNTLGGFTVSLTVSNGTAEDTMTKSTYIIVSKRGGSGGGGGGGGGGGTFIITPTPTANVTVTTTTAIPAGGGTLPLGPDNRTTQPVTIGSYDGVATISIGAGVLVTCDNGTIVRDIGISPVEEGSLPDLPGEPVYMGYAYHITPDCAQFVPAVTMTFMFTPEQWSALSSRDLVLMWYDPVKGGWTALPTSIDQAGRSVITGISDGGIYGLFARSPVTTPVQTEVPVTTPQQEMPGLPWTWILAGGVAVVAVGGAAYYLLKKRSTEGEPPGGDELS